MPVKGYPIMRFYMFVLEQDVYKKKTFSSDSLGGRVILFKYIQGFNVKHLN